MRLNRIGANNIELSFINGNRILFSYGTPVAAWIIGEGYLRTETSHHPTTSKHINSWTRRSAGSTVEGRPQEFFDKLGEAIKMTSKPSLHIEARRWFGRTNGNTYYSVRIHVGGREMHYIPHEYVYDDQWLQTALDWLASEGLAEKGEYGTRYLVAELHGTFLLSDVSCKKDL